MYSQQLHTLCYFMPPGSMYVSHVILSHFEYLKRVQVQKKSNNIDFNFKFSFDFNFL